jgi:hypothetical protein
MVSRVPRIEAAMCGPAKPMGEPKDVTSDHCEPAGCHRSPMEALTVTGARGRAGDLSHRTSVITETGAASPH